MYVLTLIERSTEIYRNTFNVQVKNVHISCRFYYVVLLCYFCKYKNLVQYILISELEPFVFTCCSKRINLFSLKFPVFEITYDLTQVGFVS